MRIVFVLLTAMLAGPAVQTRQNPKVLTSPQTQNPKVQSPVKPLPPGARNVVPPKPQPQTLRAKLTVDRNPVQIGEDVKFTLVPENPALADRFSITYMFDDGTQPLFDRLEFARAFASARDFVVRAGAVVKGVEIFTEPPEIARVTVTVTHAPLTASPSSVEAGQSTTLTTTFLSQDSNIRYRFTTSSTGALAWQPERQALVTFTAPGNYSATVDIARLVNGTPVVFDTSLPVGVVVTPVPPPPPPTPTPTPAPTPTPPPGPVLPVTPIQITTERGWWDHWWVGALAALLLVGGTAAALKRKPDKPAPMVHPEFTAHPDAGSNDRNGGPPDLAFDYQLVFDPAVAGGEYSLDSGGQPLVSAMTEAG